MTPLKWILLPLGVAGVLLYVAWWYRSREEPVRGRAAAAALRAVALSLAWLILVNPALPVGWRGAGTRGGAGAGLLIDASYSMSRPMAGAGAGAGAVAEASLWSAARDSARGAGRVWLFGGENPRAANADSLPAAPLYGETRLAPAIRAAGLAGARRVRVITDGRLDDAREAIEEARRLGMRLSVVSLATGYPEIGIASVTAPVWAQAGESIQVRVELSALRLAGDTQRVELVDAGGTVRAAAVVPAPSDARQTAARLTLRVDGPPGFQRFTARLAGDRRDPERRDDERVFYVRVAERPASPVLISLAPDWEPSFIVGSLDRVSDAPTVAYLWVADSLVRLGDYERASVARVQRQAGQAPLLVLHGYGADAPAWARELARDAARLLLFPAGPLPIELPGWNVRIGAPAGGEWYASAELPPSPLALQLGDFDEDQLPPLLRPRPVQAESNWSPLMLRRQRRGESVPALVTGHAGSRRWAVATAEGYWRWAFRRGTGRQLYRGLWTGLAGWLLEGAGSAGAGLQPLERVVERGEAVRWVTPAGVDSITVQLVPVEPSGTGGEADRYVAGGADTLELALPAGAYRYTVHAYRDDRDLGTATGPVEVEPFSRELLPGPPASLAELAAAGAADTSVGAARRQRGLATLGWPYLVLILLFCVEWAVRRLNGLR